MTTIISTHVGINRGKKRIFVEGAKLAKAGYAPDMRFNITIQDRSLCLTMNENGKYKISRRKNRYSGVEMPVIDISTKELSELFSENETVRLLVKKGAIVITTNPLNTHAKERSERLKSKLASGQPLSVFSCFHGGGILDSAISDGFESQGIKSKIAVAIEKESKYLDSSLRNNKELWSDNSVIIESPLQFLNFSSSKSYSCDIWVGGIPCTGASNAGKSKNKINHAEEHKDAGAMFFYALQSICYVQPSIIILENVASYANTSSMSVIRSVLDNLGYSIHETVLNGCDFGALENRDRLAVVALDKNIDFDISSVKPDASLTKRTLGDALQLIPEDDNSWREYSYLAEKEKRDIENKKGFRRQILTPDADYCGVITRGYAKVRSTDPFIAHPSNPNLSRLLTPEEHANVKGIPLEKINGNSTTVSHEILGQSIIYPVFKCVAKAVAQAVIGCLSYQVAS